MSDNSHIEWTDASWNPVTGCTRVSIGCDNCYAVTMTRRLAAMGQEKYQGLVNEGKGHFNGVVKCHPDELDKPLRWRKPRRIFVNSMSDLFHDGVPATFLHEVVETMRRANWHQFQVLTKRPETASEYFQHYESVPENVWIGTSVENQEAADERIQHLLRVPAAVRFLSCEPMLGPVDLRLEECWLPQDCYQLSERLHWVIVGGESGPGARPAHPDWFRSIRDQCVGAGVAFHFKQWGAWGPDEPDIPGHVSWVRQIPNVVIGGRSDPMFRVGKKAAGRLLDGREWNEFPIVSPTQ